MKNKPRTVTALLATTALALVLAGCSSGSVAEPAPVSTAPASTAAPSSSPGTLPTAVPTADPGLPEDWPTGIPGYPDGRLLSAVVSEDGRAVNGAWVSDASAADAWSTMDARLREAGYLPSAEAGGEDMLVEDETQRSDYFVRDGYEVNLVVLTGDQTTVFVNGSVL